MTDVSYFTYAERQFNENDYGQSHSKRIKISNKRICSTYANRHFNEQQQKIRIVLKTPAETMFLKKREKKEHLTNNYVVKCQHGNSCKQ